MSSNRSKQSRATHAHLGNNISRQVVGFGLLLPAIPLALGTSAALAQVGGQGAIAGSVTDSTGASIPNATVTALNVATGVTTIRQASSSGVYNLAPLLPGTYTVTVALPGFSTFKQENITVAALETAGLNVELKPGAQTDTITVSAAPPVLETTSATLGGTIDNSTYAALPLLISGGQQRDITQFSNLLPGAQVNPGGRSSIIGGTGQRVGELYVDGLPLTTANQQGDNRPVFNIVPLEAIDSIKVVTSGYSAQYQGAGLENYNLKAGTNQYHGSVFAYIRNTIFDAWTFSSKPGAPGNMVPTLVNGVFVQMPGPKPAEHQIEAGYAVGGPIKIPHLINGHDKLFFFTTYDKFRSRIGANPVVSSIPTLAERQGDFSQLLAKNGGPGYIIYDPTTQATCTANNGAPCRYPFGQAPTGKVDLTQATNIIPAGRLSPIALYQSKFLPTPANNNYINNYASAPPTGFDNWLVSGRIDYTISSKHTISGAYNQGQRHAVPYTGTATGGVATVPYYMSTLSTVAGKIIDVQDTYQITPNLVNQARYGFVYFGGPPVQNISGTNPGLYGFAAAGVTGLPAGQASTNFPNTTFSGNNPPTNWTGNTPTSTNRAITYEALDNVSLLKGRHSMNFGGQVQWLENNSDTADSASTPVNITWNSNDTAGLTNTTASGVTSTNFTANTGYSYASLLVGAVGASSVTQQPFSIVGGRFRPIALYFQDDFKLTKKLTINIGLRWDYIPPYHETLDRWSFLNPNITNPITGNPGALQFAGHRGAGLSCECTTPVQTYWKNFEPRVGFAYAVDDKTVFRGGYSLTYSHGGGTGGAGGSGTGTGQAGFSSTASFSDSLAGPAFYLNGTNSNYGGAGYVLPPITPITATSAGLNTGYYLTASGASGGIGNSIAYADPYVSGRAPQFSFFNFGMQREITKNLTISLDYSGSQSHFIAGASNIRGLYSGQVDPKYLVLKGSLSKVATPANIAAAQAATGLTLPIPYAGYTAAAAVIPTATIAHMLVWKPQYNGTSDTWGIYTANANYNSFQVALAERASRGLTFNVNYTYSQNIDDAGTQRSGYDIPAFAIATNQFYPHNRIDRSISINDQPQNLSIYGVYTSQYGKGSFLGEHFIARALLSGWQTSMIFQYSSGLPLPITGSCNATENVGQGTCMPDVNPNFQGDVRQNGKWGSGVTAATLGTVSYLKGGYTGTTSGSGQQNNDPTKAGVACATSTGPFCNSGDYMIGDSPRFPYNLRGMDNYRLNMALRRQFNISDRLKFIFGVDGSNLTNHTTFGNNAGNNQINVNPNSGATFGTLNFASADPRDFQFSGRFSF